MHRISIFWDTKPQPWGTLGINKTSTYYSFKKTVSPKNVSVRHCLKEKLCCPVFQDLPLSGAWKNIYSENSQKNVHREITLNKVFAILALSSFIFFFPFLYIVFNWWKIVNGRVYYWGLQFYSWFYYNFTLE